MSAEAEEPYEHRPINRGCGRHYGFDPNCVTCQLTKAQDDKAVAEFREEQKRKEDEKEKKL